MAMQLALALALALFVRISNGQQMFCDLNDNASFGTKLRRSAPSDALCSLPAQQQSQLQFEVISEGARITRYFGITDATITVTQPVDRDRLCDDAAVCCDSTVSVCPISIKVAVTDTGSQRARVFIVEIRIIDINDNAPTFRKSLFEFSLPESSRVGTEVSLPLAADKDSEIYSVHRYDLLGSEGAFGLTQQRDRSGQLVPRLRQLRPLNREHVANYSFVLVAHDRGSPSRSGSIALLLRVRDVNDHTPTFLSSAPYEAVVNETAPPGQRVLCVEASDADGDENGRVSYHISSVAPDYVGNDFGMDAASGCLTVRGRLNFRRHRKYSFSVVARDNGETRLSAEAAVVITVRDVNDCAPRISVSFFGKANFINESSTPVFDKTIGIVSATDDDSEKAGEVECSVDSRASKQQHARLYLQAMQQSKGSYHLLMNGSFDREAAASETLRICCHDFGQPQQSNCVTQEIIVGDVNDQAPEFSSQQETSVWIKENQPAYTKVKRMRATDADEQPNNRLQFSIDSLAAECFEIDSNTGQIRTLIPFDREFSKQFVIIVTATDSGGLSASTSLTVNIRDVNDELPTVAQPHSSSGYDFEVEEELQPGAKVGQVSASDADEGEFGRLQYSLLPSKDAGSFEIGADDGRIVTRRRLDRELQEEFNLVALIVDNPAGAVKNSASVTVRVRVLDTNDCRPSIQFPTAHNSSFGVSYQEPAGQLILQVRASDRDSGDNGLVHFDLRAGDAAAAGLFFIDESDGKVKINRDMSERDVGTYALTVVATDCGQPRLSSSSSSSNANAP